MGYEYRVKFTYESVAQVDEFLRTLPCFEKYDEVRKTYIYRTPGNTGTMPNAVINITNEGLYLCDYGMEMREFGLFINRLISYFTSLQIEDWEL